MESDRETPADSREDDHQRGPIADTELQDPCQQQRAAAMSAHGVSAPAEVPGLAFIENLGNGAYGTVWLARERNTGKHVAVKFYTHRRSLDWSLLNREVEKLAVLYTSRNIVGLLGVGWDSDPPFYIMEYLSNGSLEGLLNNSALPPSEAVRMAQSVLRGLVHAHGSGILHCDLKPANVLLDSDFEPRLCDFGQSRLSHEQDPALGTLFYMAPEQASLQAIPDARWDVYALGALLYHMLCGEAPYRTPENEQQIDSAQQLPDRLTIYRRIIREGPRPTAHRKVPGVDRRLADIVDRCLRLNPEKRFANAQAVLDALDSRDRQRQRRPLIALGVVGPVALLLIMSVGVRNLMQSAVDTARDNLTQRALESDALPARILARSVEQELDSRRRELEEIASDPAIRDTVAEYVTVDRELRQPLIDRLDSVRAKTISAGKDTSWFLTDERGVQRWRHPEDEKTMDKMYGFRDYFHGQNRDFSDPQRSTSPITRPHISIAFRSQATGLYMFAVSVPVRNAAGDVIAVLARTQHLGDLHEQYALPMRGHQQEQRRAIALVDRRAGWKLIDHPWMTREHLAAHPDSLDQLRLSKHAVGQLQELFAGPDSSDRQLQDVRLADYQDPVRHIDQPAARAYAGRWLAAFSPITGTDWIAVVQERRQLAWQPVEEMRNELIEYGLWALGICFCLIALLWCSVLRAMNDRRLPFSSSHVAASASQSTNGSTA